MSTESETFVINPYIAGSPVKDAAMFFGREDVYAWLRQHLRGKFQDNVIILYGERRSGKTSILYQMKAGLSDDRYAPVLLDLQGMGLEGMDGFLWEVARKITLALRGVEGIPRLDRPVRRDFENSPRQHFEDSFLPPVIDALGDCSLLLMFDETNRLAEKVDAGQLPPDIYNYLRALVQQVNQLNFIFSLGSRIEAAPGGSSQLFNLAVYRKISFLDRDFAEDLITRPVAEHYTYTRPAIERILQLTSGQPYYTQLLCHNLFTRWTRERPDQLDVADVEALLPDVIEQGTANFQFVWEDSTPVEQVILAALADRAPRYKAGILRRNLIRALRRARLYPPSGDLTNGLKELFERDVINDQEPYGFRVGLAQHWLTKFKRLDWVREELGEVVEQWEELEQQRLAEAPTPFERARRWAAPVLGVLLLGLLVVTVMLYQRFQTTRQQRSASETQVAQLAAVIEVNSTQAAESQIALAAVSTKVAEAETKGDSQEAAEARGTATALAVTAEALAATATRAVAEEATAMAQLVTPENVAPTSTDTPVPTATAPATASATAPPPTATPSPVPTSTPRPALADSLRGTIAYPAFNGTTYDLYFGDVANGESRRYRTNASQPAFNADGSRIAFLSWAGGSRGLVTASSSGGNEVLISNSLEDRLPTWSPDGSRILFLTRRSGGGQSELYRTPPNVDFRNTEYQYVNEGEYPTWNANDQVIFKGWGRTASGLRLASADFTSIETVTMSGEDFAPALSPDGKQVAFMGRREGNWDVYLVNIDSSGLTRLTTDPARDGLPTWSPDGRAIAFVSERDGQWAILAMAADGSNRRILFEMEGSPDSVVVNNEPNPSGWIEERISWTR